MLRLPSGLGGKLGVWELVGSKPGSLDVERLKAVNFLSLGKLANTSYSCFAVVFFTSVTNEKKKLVNLLRMASVGFGALSAYAHLVTLNIAAVFGCFSQGTGKPLLLFLKKLFLDLFLKAPSLCGGQSDCRKYSTYKSPNKV